MQNKINQILQLIGDGAILPYQVNENKLEQVYRSILQQIKRLIGDIKNHRNWSSHKYQRLISSVVIAIDNETSSSFLIKVLFELSTAKPRVDMYSRPYHKHHFKTELRRVMEESLKGKDCRIFKIKHLHASRHRLDCLFWYPPEIDVDPLSLYKIKRLLS